MKNFKLIDLTVHGDERGKLVALEKGVNCPFEIKRAFYIYATDKSVKARGCHANKNSEFLFVALVGSCKVLVDDGNVRQEFVLDNPEMALWTNKMTWKEMNNFSDGAVLLVLSSEKYDIDEYIRDYDGFLSVVAPSVGGGYDVKRAYYIWGVPAQIERGFHAHRNLKQQCFCVCGNVDFVLDNGREREFVHLGALEKSVSIGNNIWREMKNFSHDAMVLVFANKVYDENDYIHDYQQFLKEVESEL